MDLKDPSANDASSSSCPHTPTKKRTEFKKRVNHYLYDNLNRVLCELYFHCEHESNAVQCSEILNILSQASLQFHQLNRQLIVLSKANHENTKSISWNVSALSPQRLIFKNREKEESKQAECEIIDDDEESINDSIDNNNKSPSPLSSPLSSPKPCKSPKPRKPKKITKCWADYDSESDLDFDSDIIDHANHENEYEQYIKCDIEQIQKQENTTTQRSENEENQKQTEIANDNQYEIENENKNENEDENQSENEVIADSSKSTEAINHENVESIIDIDNIQNENEEKEEDENQKEMIVESIKSTQSTESGVNDENINNEEKEKKEEEAVYKTRDSNGRQQKWRKKMKINYVNDSDDNNDKEDVWFSSEFEPITLNDIMNDQSQNLLNKYEDKNGNKLNNNNRNIHNFPLPFNKMVANIPNKVKTSLFIIPNHCGSSINNNKNAKIEKLIHKLSQKGGKNYHKITQLKQQKAEKRRNELREQKNNKWQVVAAKKKQKREELRKQTEHKLFLQKQELQNKLNSAKLRYEKKLKEKKRRAKEHDIKIKNAKNKKDTELFNKREIQRKSQEEKMKNASKRYKQTISIKKQNLNQQNNKKITNKNINKYNKEKIDKKLAESQHRRNEILKQIQQKSLNTENKKKNVLQRKKQIENKLKTQNKKRNNNKRQNKKKIRKKKEKINDNLSASTSSEFAFLSSSECEREETIIIDEQKMAEILNILLLSSSEYINGIKPKREWMINCPYSELKSSIQSLCTKINRLKIHRLDLKNRDLISILNGNDNQSSNSPKSTNNISLESSFQNILKLMDCKMVEDASSTYLLMYLIDDIIELIPYLNELSLRTQRLLLQCIANATQKNRGISHYIIRSKSCLYLLHLLIKQFSSLQSMENTSNGSEIDSIIHTLTISINSIHDFPDLIDRKINFYKYLSVLKFFNKMVFLFNKIINRYTIPLNKNSNLFLRIIPFIQSVTSFNINNKMSDFDMNDDGIFDIIHDTNFYGLQQLISALVLESNGNNKHHSWKKTKPIYILRIVLYSFQTINNIARLNLKSFQQIINGMQMELYHVLSYLLQHLTFYFKSNQIIRVLLAQCILFIGYCSFKNEKFQQCLKWGDDQNNLINKLCQLPFDYFIKEKEMKILFPTLICCTFENDANCKVLNQILNKKHLIRFIVKTYHKKYNKNNNDINNNNNKNNTNNNKKNMTNIAYQFDKRFPMELWRDAIKYYKQ